MKFTFIRIQFLVLVIVTVMGCSNNNSKQSKSEIISEVKRPNIIFFIADDMSMDV